MFIKILILRQLGPDAAVRNEPGSYDIFIGHSQCTSEAVCYSVGNVPLRWLFSKLNFLIYFLASYKYKILFQFIKILILRRLGPDAAVRNAPSSWGIFIGHSRCTSEAVCYSVGNVPLRWLFSKLNF